LRLVALETGAKALESRANAFVIHKAALYQLERAALDERARDRPQSLLPRHAEQALRLPLAQLHRPQIRQRGAHQPSRLARSTKDVHRHVHQEFDQRSMSEGMRVVQMLQGLARLQLPEVNQRRQAAEVLPALGRRLQPTSRE